MRCTTRLLRGWFFLDEVQKKAETIAVYKVTIGTVPYPTLSLYDRAGAKKIYTKYLDNHNTRAEQSIGVFY